MTPNTKTLRQTGIRQRSLRRHCRPGRATELVFILATGMTLSLGGQLQAQVTATWNGATDDDFRLPGNYVGNTDPALNDFVLDDGGVTQPILGAGPAFSVNSIAVSAGTLTVDAQLNVTGPGGAITVSGGEIIIGAGGTLAGTATTSGGGTLTVNGTMDGNVLNGSVLTIGAAGSANDVTSSGTGGNSGVGVFGINGALAVTGGTFTNAGRVNGATSVSGGVLTLDPNSDLSDAGALTVSGTGEVSVAADDTVNSVLLSDTGVISGAATLTTGTYTQTGGTLSGMVDATGVKTLEGGAISGTLGGGGATTIQTGTTTVTGTITGDVTVASGTLVIGSNTAIGGTITTTGSVIGYLDGINSAAPIVIASDTTQVQVLVGTATQSGIISEDAAGRPLEKIGDGTLILTAANTYTGTTTITGGTLALANAGSTLVDTNAVVVGAGGTLRLDAAETLGSIAGGGAINLQGNTLTIGGTGGPGTTFAGIISGAGALAVTGGDTTLTGANTYGGGTTVSGGALTVSGAGTLGAAGSTVGLSGAGTLTIENAQAVTVNQSGGTLGGAGSVTNLAQTGGVGTIDALRRVTALGGTATAAAGGMSGTNAGAGAIVAVTQAGGVVNNGAGAGIDVSTSGAGNTGAVTVTTADSVTGTTIGIAATSQDGANTVTANAAVQGGENGVSARANGSGAVIVTGTGAITGGANNGILAVGAGTGPVTVSGTGTTTATGNDTNAIQASIINGGSAADILVTRSGAIIAGGGASRGVLAANLGTGNVTVTAVGPISFSAVSTGTGIEARSLNPGGGNVAVTTGGTIDGGGTGIAASNLGAGSVAVTVDHAIGGTTAPTGAGVLASAQGGATTIGVNANVTAGAAGSGVSASSTSGAIAVNVNGTAVVRGGATGLVMSTGTGAATASVAAGATVRVDTAAGGQAISLSAGAGGSAAATSAGSVIATNSPDSMAAFFAGAGTGSFTNQAGGAVQGMLGSSAAAGAFTVTNQAGATWTLNTGGSSTAAGTDDRFLNAGVLNATGPVTLAGLERFDNTGTFNVAGNVTLGAATVGTLVADNAGGTIAMQNGATGDLLTITGDYANTAPGNVTMDVDLSVQNAGTADRITATGIATGTVNLALTALPGGQQLQTPITLISAADLTGLTVVPSTTGFVLGGGGLIEYAVQKNAANTEVELIGVLNPGAVGVAANIGVVSALVGTIVNRPSSAFVGGVLFDSENNCSTGGWARVIGGQARGTATSVAGGGLGRDATVRTNYGGVQGGYDFGCFNAFEGGWDIAAGVTFGLNDGSTRQDVLSLGGIVTSTTSGKFSQSYAGAYMAFARGQVFGDLQLRADSTRFTFNNPAIGLVNDELKIASRGLSGSLSYSMPLEGDLSFVPTAGFGITRTGGGTLNYSGAPGGTLAVDPHTSQVVFAGATLARSTVGEAGDSITSQFVTGTVYSDLSSDRTATFTPGGGGLPVPVSTGNLGTFGEVSVGFSYVRIFDDQSIGAAKQLDASVRADARFSKRVNSVGLTAQMRFQF